MKLGSFSLFGIMGLGLVLLSGCHLGMHQMHHPSFLPYAGEVTAGKYDVDPVHSSVFFSTRHLNVSHFNGRFNEVTGSLQVSEQPAECSIEITVPTGSIDTNNKGRDDHLKNQDFFSSSEFPNMMFRSTTWKRKAPGLYMVEGMITVKGVEKMITAHVQRVGAGTTMFNDYRCGYDAHFSLKRSDFGIEAYLGGEDGESGGVGDTIHVHVSLEAILEGSRQPQA